MVIHEALSRHPQLAEARFEDAEVSAHGIGVERYYISAIREDRRLLCEFATQQGLNEMRAEGI